MRQEPSQSGLLVFNVGPVLCVAESAAVAVVLTPTPLTRLPGDTASPGFFKQGGRLIRVIDLRTRFGLTPRSSDSQRIMVVDTDGGALGYRVDGVQNVIARDAGQWGQTPRYVPRRVFPATLLLRDRLHLYVDLDRLPELEPGGWLRESGLFDLSSECDDAEGATKVRSPERGRTEASPGVAGTTATSAARGDRGVAADIRPRDVANAPQAEEPPRERPASDAREASTEARGAPRAGSTGARGHAHTALRPAGHQAQRTGVPRGDNTPPRPTHQGRTDRASGPVAKRESPADRPVPASPAASSPVDRGGAASEGASRRVERTGGAPARSDADRAGPVEGASPAFWLLLAVVLLGVIGGAWWGLAGRSELSAAPRPLLEPVPQVSAREGAGESRAQPAPSAPMDANRVAPSDPDSVPPVAPEAPAVTTAEKPAPAPVLPPAEGPRIEGDVGQAETPVAASMVLEDADDAEALGTLTREGDLVTLVLEELPDEGGDMPRPDTEQPEDEAQVAEAVATPTGASAPPVAAPQLHEGREVQREIVHVVVRGDTLWAIAERYLGNPWRYPELARLSRIRDPDLIYPGNRVRILIVKREAARE